MKKKQTEQEKFYETMNGIFEGAIYGVGIAILIAVLLYFNIEWWWAIVILLGGYILYKMIENWGEGYWP